MHIALKSSLVIAGLFLAAPSASALPSSMPRASMAESGNLAFQIATKHHRKHAKRKGCRLTHDGLVCGRSKHGGGHKSRHGKGHGNEHGGNRH